MCKRDDKLYSFDNKAKRNSADRHAVNVLSFISEHMIGYTTFVTRKPTGIPLETIPHQLNKDGTWIIRFHLLETGFDAQRHLHRLQIQTTSNMHDSEGTLSPDR